MNVFWCVKKRNVNDDETWSHQHFKFPKNRKSLSWDIWICRLAVLFFFPCICSSKMNSTSWTCQVREIENRHQLLNIYIMPIAHWYVICTLYMDSDGSTEANAIFEFEHSVTDDDERRRRKKQSQCDLLTFR